MPSPLFERTRGEPSGQSYRKIRIHKPEVVDRVVQALPTLVEKPQALSASGDRLRVRDPSSRAGRG
jgi:hypothetical protein